MNKPYLEGTVLGSPHWESRLVITSNQSEQGQVGIALAKVSHIAGTLNASGGVYRLDRLTSAPVVVDAQSQLVDQGWEVWGVAMPSPMLDVACGRGGENGLDNAGSGVVGSRATEDQP